MLRAFATTSRSALRSARGVSSIRTLSTTSKQLSDAHAPPALLGEGAPPGTVPTDENQSTGLERLQILGHLEGIDVFDMQPLEVPRLGTVKEPILVKSLVGLTLPFEFAPHLRIPVPHILILLVSLAVPRMPFGKSGALASRSIRTTPFG
jgi:hypothetical protein